MFPLEELQQLLAESDFVVLTLPLTAETTKFIGEEELRAMKSTAYLINVASGGVVDEEALIRALDDRPHCWSRFGRLRHRTLTS